MKRRRTRIPLEHINLVDATEPVFSEVYRKEMDVVTKVLHKTISDKGYTLVALRYPETFMQVSDLFIEVKDPLGMIYSYQEIVGPSMLARNTCTEYLRVAFKVVKWADSLPDVSDSK